MAGFYYFIPGNPDRLVTADGARLSESAIREAGLWTVFSDAMVVPRDVIVQHVEMPQPPFNGCGVMLYPKANGVVPRVKVLMPSKQEWVQAKGYWIGWERGALPAPDDLRRTKVYSAYDLLDDHDQAWMIPIVRSPNPARGSLPVSYGFDLATEQYVQHVKATHQPIWDLCGEIVDRVIKRVSSFPETEWLIDAALRILQVNYRITRAGIEMLRRNGNDLLESQRVMNIMLLACDWELLEEYEQKKTDSTSTAPDSSRPSTGTEDDFQDTALAAAN